MQSQPNDPTIRDDMYQVDGLCTRITRKCFLCAESSYLVELRTIGPLVWILRMVSYCLIHESLQSARRSIVCFRGLYMLECPTHGL